MERNERNLFLLLMYTDEILDFDMYTGLIEYSTCMSFKGIGRLTKWLMHWQKKEQIWKEPEYCGLSKGEMISCLSFELDACCFVLIVCAGYGGSK